MDLLAQNRTYHEAQSSMELLPNYYAWTYRKFVQHINGDVVELGCGSGTGIRYYLGRVRHVFAIDHNDELLQRINRTLNTNKVTAIKADLMGEWRELRGIQADTVILMDVLEHFRDDTEFLRKAGALLRPGGKIAIKVPGQSRLYSSIDEASGHFRRYDPADLRRLARRVGLDCQYIRHMNPLGALSYRLEKSKHTNFSRTFSEGQLRLINRVMRLIELGDYIPYLPGLSLVCVLSKPVSRIDEDSTVDEA